MEVFHLLHTYINLYDSSFLDRQTSNNNNTNIKHENELTDEEIEGTFDSPKNSNNNNSNDDQPLLKQQDDEEIIKIKPEECLPSPPPPTPPASSSSVSPGAPPPTTVHTHNKRKSPSPIRIIPTTIVPSHPPQLTPPMSASEVAPPPSKMPRMTEDSLIQRQQSQHHLELLCRLYPEQKRGVLELILKGCNFDLVQAIECILPSHERAIQQLSTMPNQSFSIDVNGGKPGLNPPMRPGQFPPHHAKEAGSKHSQNPSAFVPFSTSQSPNLPPTHAYGTPCDCADCLKHPGSNGHHLPPPHSPKSMPHHILTSKSGGPGGHRMVPYIPVSSHTPHTEPVKICAGCRGKMKLEDQRCPNCEPETNP